MGGELAGKIAFVTGGGKGIGRVISSALAARGAHVIINYFHSEDAAQAALAAITGSGGSAELVRGSVASEESVRDMFGSVAGRHGGLDILINNAARGTLASLPTLRDQDWSKAMAVNVEGARRCAQAAAPLMAGRRGSIVNLSSIGAGHVMGNYAAIGVSKAALEALTRYLAVELAAQGIRVNTASAGLVDSATMRLFPDSDGLRDMVVQATPLGRLATEADLAEVVLFLASDKASFITGQMILADGGLSLASRNLSPPATRKDQPRIGATEAAAEAPPSDDAAADQLVAVVGMGMTVPGASSPEEFWALLSDPPAAFTEPGSRFAVENFYSADPSATDRTYSRVAGYIHHLTPHPLLAAEETANGPVADEAVRWLRHSLLQARDGVRLTAAQRSAVYVGAWPGGSQSLAEYLLTETLGSALGEDGAGLRDVLTGRYRRARAAVSSLLPEMMVRRAIEGIVADAAEVLVIDTACSSSLYAVDLGAKALLAGDCDICYCGGVEVLDPTSGVMFAKLGGLSHSGAVRSFDTTADGTLFSDGASMVTLKLLSRARADGDQILGILAGFGAAADGKGKSIAAPNPRGQQLAVTRARAVNGIAAADVDWIVAHATGTSAGDRAELETLAALAPPGGYLCSSNKAVVGHTGWAAGTVSLIHALLAFGKQRIPGQQAFAVMPAGADPGRARVSTAATAFPASGRRQRIVGVSAFGFGGTNGHLLVTDRPGVATARSGKQAADSELVMVGWSAHLPGGPSHDQVRAWLRDQGPAPDRCFGDPYPAPGPVEVRLAPRTIAAIDPCHLMAIQVADRFISEHGELWEGLREATGVIAAHSGVPLGLAGAVLRAYADDVIDGLNGSDTGRSMAKAVDDVIADLRERIPECSEDTQPGVMTNVIASRITGRHDLRGASLTIDAGPDSALAALGVARRYLHSRELDLALLLSVNGNASSELAGIIQRPPGTLAEGAFLIAVTTAAMARQRDWPVFARLTVTSRAASGGQPPEAGAGDHGPRDYLAAQMAIALLRAAEGAPGAPSRLAGGGIAVQVTAAEQAGAATALEPAQSGSTGQPAAGTRQEAGFRTQRFVHALAAAAAPPAADAAAIPPGSVVLADCPETIGAIRVQLDQAGAIILDGGEDTEARLGGVDHAMPSLTIVCGPGPSGQAPADIVTADQLRLHELAFLAAQRLWPRWTRQSSLAVLLAGQPADGKGQPVTGLFTGMIKSLAWEKPESAVFAVLTDEPPDRGLRYLAAERSVDQPATVTWYLGGTRYRQVLVPGPLPRATPPIPVDDESVLLVTGGAGGLPVAMIQALSRHARPSVWLLGRGDPAAAPAELLAADNQAVRLIRADLIRQLHDSDPARAMRSVVNEVNQHVRARQTHRNCQHLAAALGADRVHYIRCDVRDAAAVTAAVQAILAAEGRIDLVLHAAGLSSPALLEHKTLSTFRAVRDTKVLGYQNVKAALSTRTGRAPARWCNVGSAAGAYGMPGDADYASGNDFLAACAETSGQEECTIAFTLWGETGLGADPASLAYLESQGRLTPITTAEGTSHFLSELAGSSGCSVYIGDTERRLLAVGRPGYLAENRTARTMPTAASHYLRGPAGSEPGRASWTCAFSPDRDSYLRDHLVDGKPTVPGTLMLEIAAEAAEALCPGLLTTGFRHASFEAFIRPWTGRHPRELRITAERIGDLDAAAIGRPACAVRVTLTSAVATPDGDDHASRTHFRADVLLGHGPPGAARPDPPAVAVVPGPAGRPVSDPYYQAASPVLLTGIFANTAEGHVSAGQRTAIWTPSLDGDSFLSGLRVPFLMLCATARTFALAPVTSTGQAVYVPRAIGRIELHVPGTNDLDLTTRYGPGTRLVCAGTPEATFRAVAPDGTILLELSDVAMAPMGTVPLTKYQADVTALENVR